MSIKRLPSGTWQAKLQDDTLQWISKTFPTKRDAEAFDRMLKQQKHQGGLVQSAQRKITLDEFFLEWYDGQKNSGSPGWQKEKLARYQRDISPVIGSIKIHQVKRPQILRVLSKMSEDEKSSQTQVHVYNLLRKIFGDAVEIYEILTSNPVVKSLKPRPEIKETRHLNLTQTVALLNYVKDRPFGTAIWLQLFLGLRVSEVIALQWDDLDLQKGEAHIRRSYSRKNVWATQDKSKGMSLPKGRKQLTIPIPPELSKFLREAKRTTTSVWVSPSPSTGEMLSYEYYLEILKAYCAELNLPKIATHGLRHSTSEILKSNGATNDIVGKMLRQSSPEVTKRYIHGDDSLTRTVSGLRILSSGGTASAK